MPDDSRGGHAVPPGLERKAARIAARRAELARVAPLLLSLPWRSIRAGYARIKDIDGFVRFYEMYAPLLAECIEELEEARDSGEYVSFDLHASAGGLVVTATDRQGESKVLCEIRKDYWEGEYSPGGAFFTPL
ncbi:MAG: hypothetical protein C4536_11145 [Actinobacteria bacterium]|jgi:hypothetical protein|nr:MAG: hypothetical protein C4536_11145 [Actinomycetota bacterium]